MRKLLTFILALLLIPSVTSAAIAFDSTADGGATGASPKVWNQTIVTAGAVVVVCVYAGDATDLVSGVTGNGAAMTKVKSGVTNIYYNSMWISAAATTSGNYAVRVTSSGGALSGHSMAYTGASATADSSNFGSATGGTSLAATTTTVADNSWQVTCATSNGANPTASTGWTQRGLVTGANIAGDSNGPLTPAGLKSMTFTYTVNSDFISMSIAPTAVAASPFFINAFWSYFL